MNRRVFLVALCLGSTAHAQGFLERWYEPPTDPRERKADRLPLHQPEPEPVEDEPTDPMGPVVVADDAPPKKQDDDERPRRHRHHRYRNRRGFHQLKRYRD